MNNQYSRGCGYNYRRSAQKDMNPTCSSVSCNCMRESEPVPAVCPAIQPRSAEPCFTKSVTMQKPLAMGYVPMQEWRNLFPICKGLQAGTIFADLCKPFCGKGGACR